MSQPTQELVSAAVRQFELENGTDERALAELFRSCPSNTDRAHVLLKVAAVNSIYSTNIYAFKDLAKYISERGDEIDCYLECGDLRAFELIERYTTGDEKERHPFSFASKYCSWQRPNFYPIYDSFTEAYLWQLLKADEPKEKHALLWTYASFKGVVDRVQERYGLQSFSYKQIDAFFYLQGSKLLDKPTVTSPS